MRPLSPVSIRWRSIAFGAALFWFWYLVPIVAESRTLGGMFRLLRP